MAAFAASALLLAGCASAGGAPKTPRMSDRHLRPMNQDLAAWLARINAVPAPATQDPVVSAGTARSEPGGDASSQPQLRVESLPPLAAQPELSSGTAPSPTASPTKPPATASNTPAPSPTADAVAAAGALIPPPGRPNGQPEVRPGPPSPAAVAPAAAPQPNPVAAADPAVEPVKEPVPVEVPKPIWKAEAGGTLRTTLLGWAKEAGWPEPRWDAPVDYPIVGTMVFEGDFLDALRGLFKAHAGVSRPVHVDVYTTQKFIHVTE